MLIQVRNLEDLKTFSGMVLQQRVVGSSTEHNASSRSHAIIRMEVAMMILMTMYNDHDEQRNCIEFTEK